MVVVSAIIVGRAASAQRPSSNDSSAVAEFNHGLEQATRRMDNTATLGLWDDEGISLTPGSNALLRKKAIAAFLGGAMQQIAGATMQSFEMRCFDIHVARPLATEWCVEHQVVLLADRTTFDGWGKMALVLRRGSDGKWRLKQEAWLPGLPSDSLLLLRPARR